MRCAMTDREYPEFSDGVWDDGEWISWDCPERPLLAAGIKLYPVTITIRYSRFFLFSIYQNMCQQIYWALLGCYRRDCPFLAQSSHTKVENEQSEL